MTAKSVVATVSVVVFVACLAVLSPSPAAAQQVGGGVKAGVTLGDIPNGAQALEDALVDSSQRIGFAAGAFIMIRSQSGFALQPEFLYTQKGVKFGDTGGSSANVTVKTDFLDVPVLARYTFGKGLRGYLFGGPSFDFKLSAKTKAGGLIGGTEEDIGDNVKSFEFAVVVGAGIELGPILVEARWSEGLTNLDAAPTAGSPELKTRTFLFLGGLRF
jgi:hypothetical protein